MDENWGRPKGTILGSGLGPWLISNHIRSWEWESFARREPKPARERLGPLTFKPINHGPKP
jgi:hypothetical protein